MDRMSVKKELFTCMIHDGILIDPVTCQDCNNNFCNECATDSKKRKDNCPYCGHNPFNFERNNILRNLINSMVLICNKCGRKFEKNEEKEYDDHILKCVKLSCLLCKKDFYNTNDFSEHILKDNYHLNIISLKFDTNISIQNENSSNGILPGIYQDPSKPRHYLNLLNKARKVDISKEQNINFENVDSLIQNNINVPKECVLNPEMDLYFCYQKTNLNCKCCKDQICQPGNCLCKRCMNLNKEYHGLKMHYLINKAGRAARYSKRHFHCYCKYIKQVKNDNGNVFNNKFFCGDITYCPPCLNLNDLMDHYLGDLANVLREKY